MYRQGNKENEPVLKGLVTVIERSEKRLSTHGVIVKTIVS